MADVVTKETTVTNTDTQRPDNAQEVAAIVTPKVEKYQRMIYLMYFIFGILEVLLAFRLVFKLAGANPGSSFVSLIYSFSDLFVWPFTGIFRTAVTQGVETAAVLEPATLVAMAVYAILPWGISKLIVILSGRAPQSE